MSAYDYGYGQTHQKSAWYYLIFPIDAWRSPDIDGEGSVFAQQKQHEVFPVMLWLLPMITLLAGFTLKLGFFSALFFFAIESLFLGLVCIPYLGLKDLGYAINLMFNFWVSQIVLSFMTFFVLLFFGIFF
jgi:hypothetical protein